MGVGRKAFSARLRNLVFILQVHNFPLRKCWDQKGHAQRGNGAEAGIVGKGIFDIAILF